MSVGDTREHEPGPGRSDPALDALILAYFADTIEADDLAALDARLRSDAWAAQRFATLAHHEVLLGRTLRTREGHPDHPSSRMVPPRLRPSFFRRWSGLAALVALGLLLTLASVAVVHVRRGPGTTPSTDTTPSRTSPLVLAQVIDSQSSAQLIRGSRSLPLRVPMPVLAGDVLLAPAASVPAGPVSDPKLPIAFSAQMVIRYADGTELELGADSQLAFDAPAQATARDASDRRSPVSAADLTLQRGQLRARVAHHDPLQPLVLVTPQAHLQVIGTQLAVSVAATATRLVVSEGRVQMVRLSDGAQVEVGAGQAATARSSTSPGEAFLVVPVGSLADGVPMRCPLYFHLRFADEPGLWQGALGLPLDTLHGTLGLRTVRTAAGTPQDVRIPFTHAGASGARIPSTIPTGGNTLLMLRYQAQRISTGMVIEIEAVDQGGRRYRCRLLPQLDGEGLATVPLDRSFTAVPTDTGVPSAPQQPAVLADGQQLTQLCVRLRTAEGGIPPIPAELYLNEVLAYAGPTPTRCTPTLANPPLAPGYHYVWDFDKAEPSGFTILGGSWQHLPQGGFMDSGCMETTSPYFAASIDIPPPTRPVRITVLQRLLPPATQGDYSVFVQWDQLRSLTYAHRPPTLMPLKSGVETAFNEVVEYLSDHHVEARLLGERSALSWCEPVPGAHLVLLVIGHNRLDNLCIESVDAERMPSITDSSRALLAMPRPVPGTPVIAPLDSDDPERPYTVEVRQLVPGKSPWYLTQP